MTGMTRQILRIAAAVGLLALGPQAASAQAGEPPPLLQPPLVEAVRVEGLRRTSESAVREILGVQVGERLDAKAAWSGRRRLLERGWYESVDLRLARGTSAGLVVVVVTVRELGPVSLSADLSNFSDGVLSVGATYQPPGWPAVSAETFLGEEVPGYALGLDVPDLFGSKVSFSARGYHRGRESLFPTVLRPPPGTDPAHLAQETGLSFSRTGFSVEAGRAFGSRSALSVSLGYRLERLEGTNHYGALAVGGESQMLSALSVGLAHSTLDADAFPSAGHRVRLRLALSGTALGSDYGFTRLTGQAEQWLPLSRPFVARLELRGGVLGGQAPFSERLFAGDLVRGYSSFKAAGGLGADRGLAGGFELGLDLEPHAFLRRVRLLGFVELGVLWSDAQGSAGQRATAASAGVGVQMRTRFGLLGLSVPLWTRDLGLSPAESLPFPVAPWR
jgi:outer membrane protein assembly factor BamA